MSKLTDWNDFEHNVKCQRDLTDRESDVTTVNVKIVQSERLTFGLTIQIVDIFLTLQRNKIQLRAMSNLTIDQKTVKQLFQDKKADFLIPDYQRPYAWGISECRTLWEDLFSFAFPSDDIDSFNENEEYFLGSIVTFKNDRQQQEIIDGQQRITTLMLLLRAFYNKFRDMPGRKSERMKENLEMCIWKTDADGEYNPDDVKIMSEVATDNDREEFAKILITGDTEGMGSRYAKNFDYFRERVGEFLVKYVDYFRDLPNRILNNCVLLPIEAETQDTALRIFSTLNDRGKPLSDSDIFKAQMYKFYSSIGEKDKFMETWKWLDETTSSIFHPIYGTPLDELFTRYMYYERALGDNTSSTVEALRKFYEKDGYAIFRRKETLDNIVTLAKFWKDVLAQDEERFSENILRRFFVLDYSPNGMWRYMVTVYFMHNKDNEDNLDEDTFAAFLDKITAFTFAYAITNPGVGSLRLPMFTDMQNIVNDKDVTFTKYKFDETRFRSVFQNYNFSNSRLITKAMLTWWAFHFDGQKLVPLYTPFDIEHVYPRSRQQKEGTLKDKRSIELLGNKSLLERRINIRASDYRFADKMKYYNGFTTSKGEKQGTDIQELRKLTSSATDFTEQDIIDRNKRIIDGFVEYLRINDLLQ